MKRLLPFLFLVFLLIASAGVYMSYSDEPITSIILVRHAEKADDGTNDPPLTGAGRERAQALVQLLHETEVSAIYSTPYKRTRETVQPLAEAEGLVLSGYEPNNATQMDELFAKHKGKIIVICGHSNTTPWIANYFLGHDEYNNFKETDYDNVLVLSIVEQGQASVTWLNYGEPTR